MRYLSFFLLALMAVAGCKTVKKVSAVQQSFTKKDTIPRIIISEVPKVDSEAIVKSIMGKVMKKKIDFKTFNAKLKVDYEGGENSMPTFTAYVSIK